jgi:hypothetical protein
MFFFMILQDIVRVNIIIGNKLSCQEILCRFKSDLTRTLYSKGISLMVEQPFYTR